MSTEDNANVLVLPPILFGVGIGGAYLLRWLFPVRLVPLRFESEAALAGSAVALAGLAFGGWAFATFVRARTTPHPNHPVNALVTWGPYRFSRNPMYVGLSVSTAGPLSWRIPRGSSRCFRPSGSRSAAS